MQLFLKKNKLAILIFIIMIIWCSIELVSFNSNSALNNVDAITMFFYILTCSSLNFLPFLAPIFIIIPTIWNFHTELHSGSIKNFLIRMDYKKYMKRIFKNSLKYIWILVFTISFLFISCVLITKSFDFSTQIPKVIGEMDGHKIIEKGISTIPLKFYYTPVKLMITFFVVLLLHSILYANFGLILCKSSKNKVISIIASFLSFIFLDIFSEILLGGIFEGFLNIGIFSGMFNLFGIWTYADYKYLFPVIIYSIILVIFSYLFVYLCYRNKERTVIEIEK